MTETIHVEVAWADPHRQLLRVVELPAGTTVAAAIDASGILAELPQFVPNKVGIFGRVAAMDTALREGDRVELYRPLKIDPKQARRNRVRG